MKSKTDASLLADSVNLLEMVEFLFGGLEKTPLAKQYPLFGMKLTLGQVKSNLLELVDGRTRIQGLLEENGPELSPALPDPQLPAEEPLEVLERPAAQRESSSQEVPRVTVAPQQAAAQVSRQAAERSGGERGEKEARVGGSGLAARIQMAPTGQEARRGFTRELNSNSGGSNE